MRFSLKKLPKEAISQLRRVPIGICEPFTMMMVPVYVYLPKNGRFVAVKAPLHCFTAEEFEKFKSYENIYLPEFVDELVPFRKAGETVRNLLTLQQQHSIKTNAGLERLKLVMPQHELDDAVLRAIGPLWGGEVKLDPCAICCFTNEVCHPFPVQNIVEAMERDIDLFELAILRSSGAVFLALHIGYCDTQALALLRSRVFADTLSGSKAESGFGQAARLFQLVWAMFPDTNLREISLSEIQERFDDSGIGGKVTRKILSRLKRVQSELLR